MLEFQIEITRGCHLECLHCSSDAQMLKDGFRFNFEALSAFMKPIKESAFLYLSGGEPLLVRELSRHIKNLSSDKLTIGIYSSGVTKLGKNYRSITLEQAITLKNAGLKECYFSIYDTNPNNHDAITNINGSFDLTLGSIHNFIAVGIDAKIHLVLNSLLLNHIESTIKTLHSYGVKEVRLLSLVKSGRAQVNWGKIGVDSNSQMEKLKSILSNSSAFNGRVTFSGIPEYVACRPLNDDIGCVAGRKLFYITYEGEVFPCAGSRNRSAYSLGNIETSQFDNIRPFSPTENACLNRGSELWHIEGNEQAPHAAKPSRYFPIHFQKKNI